MKDFIPTFFQIDYEDVYNNSKYQFLQEFRNGAVKTFVSISDDKHLGIFDTVKVSLDMENKKLSQAQLIANDIQSVKKETIKKLIDDLFNVLGFDELKKGNCTEEEMLILYAKSYPVKTGFFGKTIFKQNVTRLYHASKSNNYLFSISFDKNSYLDPLRVTIY